MAHQNTSGTYQMLPIKQEEGYNYPVPNCYTPSDSTDYYLNPNNYPVMPSGHEIVNQTTEQCGGYYFSWQIDLAISMAHQNTSGTYQILPIKQEEGEIDLTTSMAHQNTSGTYQMLPIKQGEGCNYPIPNCYTPSDSTDYYPNPNNYPVMPSGHEIVNQTQEQGGGYYYPPSGNGANYPNQYAYPPVHASRNVADSNLHQLVYDHGRHAEDQSQFSRNKFYHPVSDVGPGVPTPYTAFIPHDNGFSEHFAPVTNVDTGIVSNDYSNHYYLADGDIIHHKRKLPEMYVENYYTANEPTYPNLSSGNIYRNSEQPQRVGPNGGIHLTNQSAFTSQSHNGSDTFPTRNGIHGTSISGSSAIDFLPQRGFTNENSMHQPCHPSSAFWADHPDSYNENSSSGVSRNNGGWLHPEAVESRNMHLEEYPCASINRNSSMVHPSTSFNHHQHVPSAPDIHVHLYNQYAQVAAPYVMPFSNHNQYMDSTFIISRPLQSSAEAIEFFIFPEVSYAWDSEDEDNGSELDYPHYDVDHMSYEELLDLEEHMGHVCTGLSEDSIMKNLKKQVWAPRLSLSLSDISSESSDESSDETCAICLERYQELEMLGSLDCGHSYHADCVKQWLSIKNLCPICRETALAADGRDS